MVLGTWSRYVTILTTPLVPLLRAQHYFRTLTTCWRAGDPIWDLPAMFGLQESGLHNVVSAQLSSKTDPPVAVTRVLYIGRTVSKATLILQTRLSLLRSLTGTTFSFPLSSTTKGIFSGLIHECESTELHTRVFTACTTCTTLCMTGQAACEIISDKKKRVILEQAQLDDVWKIPRRSYH